MNENKLRQSILIFDYASKVLEKISQDGFLELEKQAVFDRKNRVSATEFKTTISFTDIENSNHQIAESTKKFLQIIPQALFVSFQTELTLKLLIYQKNNQEERGHDLSHLFNQLNDSIKNNLIKSITEKLNISEDQFNKFLTTNSRIFEKWRYHHEPADIYHLDMKFLKPFYEELYTKIEKS